MSTLATILLTIGCLLISYQDVKYKYVSLSSIFVLSVGLAIAFHINKGNFATAALNVVFVLFFLTVMRLYILIRKGKNERFVNRYMGIADIILFFIFSPSFTLVNYIGFILIACFSGLIYWLVVKFTRPDRKIIRIPLAGIMSLVYIPSSYYLNTSPNIILF